jgi:hypothetical protein
MSKSVRRSCDRASAPTRTRPDSRGPRAYARGLLLNPNTTHCRACQGSLSRAFDAVVLGDVPVTYHRCDRCGSLMLLDPYWLPRSYATVFNPDPDHGRMRRTLFVHRFLRRLRASGVLPRSYSSLDYGSGFGILVRLLRDRGADAWGYDRYATPIFAEPFCQRELPDREFDLVTSIEVIEHTENPVEVLTLPRERLKDDGVLVVSTEFVDGQSDLAAWHYLALEHGQHVTMFSRVGLRAAAHASGLEWVRSFVFNRVPFLHVFVRTGHRPGALKLIRLAIQQVVGEITHSTDHAV